jgi:RND superfamily putative drug exporter
MLAGESEDRAAGADGSGVAGRAARTGPQRLFARVGKIVVRWPYLVVLAWVLITFLAVNFLPSLSSVAKSDTAFLPASAPSMRAAELRTPFQRENVSTALIVAAREQGRLTAADRKAIARVERAVRRVPSVVGVRDQGLSQDGQAQRLFVQLDIPHYGGGGSAEDAVGQIRSSLRRAGQPGLKLYLTGQLPLRIDNNTQTHRIQRNTELYSVVFIILLLLFVFRAPLAPLVTLAPAALALVLAGPVIAEATKVGVEASEMTRVLLIVLMLGAGTDYGLFLIFREREELARGLEPREAVERALERVGETITYSAATVVAALVCMLLATFAFYRSLGPALAIGIVLILLAGLTLLPALLAIFGRAVFWPQRPRAGKVYRGAWGALAGRVVRRPGTTLALGIILFGGVSFFLLANTPAGFSGGVPKGSDSARGQALVARHFAGAAANPTNLLFRLPESFWRDPARLAQAESELEASELFSSLSGPLDPNGMPVSPARLARLHVNLGDPALLPERPPPGIGVPPLLYQAYRSSGQFISRDGKTIQLYASLVAGDSSGTEAMNAIPAIRGAVERAASVLGASESGVAGQAAGSYDVSASSSTDLFRIVPIVLAAIAILLAVLLRSVVAPVYLIISVCLSYLAALGLAVLAFVIIGGAPGLNFVLPFFMFIFLMALGEDYNILVMSRIREEATWRPLREAVTRAVGATGTTITSAGLILAGTFGVLTIAASGQIREIGLGLAAGILIDTFLVRTMLVPSTVALVGRWNWWPSRLGRRQPALATIPVSPSEPV